MHEWGWYPWACPRYRKKPACSCVRRRHSPQSAWSPRSGSRSPPRTSRVIDRTASSSLTTPLSFSLFFSSSSNILCADTVDNAPLRPSRVSSSSACSNLKSIRKSLTRDDGSGTSSHARPRMKWGTSARHTRYSSLFEVRRPSIFFFSMVQTTFPITTLSHWIFRPSISWLRVQHVYCAPYPGVRHTAAITEIITGTSEPLTMMAGMDELRASRREINSTLHHPLESHELKSQNAPGISLWAMVGHSVKKCELSSMYAGIEFTAAIRSVESTSP
mmetsp:Transcript_80358/g.228821  ORF Transcript_80358/g.228821 Transcript_80358/m.228821 type:complete len:274 (+) Transcript_80358:1398-2219(+)